MLYVQLSSGHRVEIKKCLHSRSVRKIAPNPEKCTRFIYLLLAVGDIFPFTLTRSSSFNFTKCFTPDPEIHCSKGTLSPLWRRNDAIIEISLDYHDDDVTRRRDSAPFSGHSLLRRDAAPHITRFLSSKSFSPDY